MAIGGLMADGANATLLFYILYIRYLECLCAPKLKHDLIDSVFTLAWDVAAAVFVLFVFLAYGQNKYL